MNWRRECRQCGRRVVTGRAWCRKHLRLVELGCAVDVDDVPTQVESRRPLELSKLKQHKGH